MITDQPDDMPVFVLKAKDRLALATVWAYYTLCENAGLDGQAAQVALAVDEIREWQRRNPDRLQLPDHPHVPVEGSTPIASPARPCGMHYSWQSDGVRLAGTLGPCVLDVGHYVAPHRDEHGNEWSSQGLLVIDPQPADEPAPVPPPVDALLNLVDDLHSAVADDDGNEIDRAKGNIVMAARDLWAAGVAEGRRLLDETAATAAAHAYELGIAEGRRQAAAAIRAADTSGWPGGRGGDVDECQELAAKIAEVLRG